MRRLATVTGLLLMLLLSNCRRDDQQTVARFTGGRITLRQLDRAVLATPPAQRPASADRLPWLRQLARRLAVQRLLLAEAKQLGLEPPWPDAELRRRVVTEVFVSSLAVAPVSEAQLHQLYQERQNQLRQPERRLARHIFRRQPPALDHHGTARRESLLIRDRLLAGADFAELAASESHSETRHQGGLLGWVQRGDLDDQLEEVLFSLPAGVPSQPISGPGGLHILQVEEIRPAAAYAFDEVRSRLTTELQAYNRQQALDRAIGESTLPPADGIDMQELRRLLDGNVMQAVVWRSADSTLTLTLDDLRRSRRPGSEDDNEPLSAAEVAAHLADLEQRERIYRHCVHRGLDRSREIEQRLAQLHEKMLVEALQRLRLREMAAAEAQHLQRYFADHRRRYSTPLRLRLRRLHVALAAAGPERMALLEEARQQLDSGAVSFDDLAARLGGEVEALAWLTLPQLRRLPGRAAQLALELRVGEHSPPFLAAGGLEMLRLLERQEPHQQSFEQVRQRVIDDYLTLHGQRLYARLSTDLLERARYRDLPTRLAAFIDEGMV